MSQYLSFHLKKKDDPNIRIELGYWSTTPSRMLSSEDVFQYTENEILVTSDVYTNNMEKMESYMQDVKIRIQQEKDKHYLELFQNCRSKEAAEVAFDKLEDSLLYIKDMQEELELWSTIKASISTYWEIAQGNEQYDLYYVNA